MDELQLHDLKNIDAGQRTQLARSMIHSVSISHTQAHLPAVDVKQNASPAIHDDPTEPNKPASGRDSRTPMGGYGG